MYDPQETKAQKSDFNTSKSKAGIQRKNKNSEFQKEMQLKEAIQLKTEVTHNSGMQSYQDENGQIKRQLVGMSMTAYLDPYDPLLGTESSAFNRSGIYEDPSYSFKDKEEHESAKGPTAMHLLNAHLGGLAIDENLFPQRAEMNRNHLNVAEYNAKAKLLTLRNYTKEQLDGARVYYGVQVWPADSVLTPKNMMNSQFFVFGPSYVNKFNNVINDDWETDVIGNSNESLDKIGWSVKDQNDIAIGNKVNLNNESYEGSRNHFQENIIHTDEKGEVTRRTHHHDSRGLWSSGGIWDEEENDF